MHACRAVLAVANLVVTLLAGHVAAQDLTAEEAQAIAEEAYVYGVPLVENYANLYAEAVDASSARYVGPLNTLKSAARFLTPDEVGARTPNPDVATSIGWLDLRVQPVVLDLPEIEADRYHSVQLVDLYGFNFDYLGTRTSGNAAGSYLLAGPAWSGEAPAGIARVLRSETDFVRAIYKTQVFGQDDVDSVRAIQAQYTLQPLSAFLGEAPPQAPAKRAISRASTRALGFYVTLDEALRHCTVAAEEVELRARLARIAIGTAEGFAAREWSFGIRTALQAGLTAGQATVDAGVTATKSGALHGNRETLGGDMLRRAVGVRLEPYGDSRESSLSRLYVSGAEGGPLDASAKSYVLNLSGANLPPVDGFWSITMYDRTSEGLVANPIDRYRIDSRMLESLKPDAGGGLSLYLRRESPGAETEANWLPAPDGPFYVVMRLYWPRPEAIDGTWKAPLVFAEKLVEKAAPLPTGAGSGEEVAPLVTSEEAQPEMGRPTTWGEPTEVRLGIYILDVDEVSSAQQNFAASLIFEAHWNSPSLRHKGPGPQHRNLVDIWTPRLTILGQQAVWSSFPEAVEIQPDGEVVYRQKVWGRFSQPLDLRDFPRDTQTLKVHIICAELLEKDINILPLQLEAGRQSGIGRNFSVPDFKVLSWEAGPVPFYPFEGEEATAGFQLSIEMEREFGYYVMKIIIPLCMIVIMSWLPRWLSLTDAGPNIGISTTAFLTLVAYLFAITVLLPPVSYTTRMDRFILLSMFLVFACLVQTIANTILVRKGHGGLAKRVDVASRVVYPILLIIVLWVSFYR